MTLKGIFIPKKQADKLKELARDKSSFRCNLVSQLVSDLAGEIPDYDNVNPDEKSFISFKAVSDSEWRKIERFATVNNVSPTQMIKGKINRYLKDNK